jgi:hypothetical protein
VKGNAWNIGTVITEKEDVSEQGAHLIFNDRLNPDNGVNSIRPQMAVDNSNEALSPYDKVYLEPGTINLFTSPIVGSQTTDVYVTSIKLTSNSVVNLSIVDKNDNPLSDGRFALTNASGEPISSLTTDAEGSLDNKPVYITFVRPEPEDESEDKTAEDQTYEAFLKIVPAESASADEQLLLRIPLRGHHKSKLETIGGAWTVGAFQQRDPKPVDKIIWHGLTSDEWDNRNNWYKEDGTLVTCLDALTEDLTVIIPAKDSEKYLTPEIVSVMQDKELIDCINAFFANNLNISETSRNAFLHRNTLLYRIEKISRVTGLNIRNFDDAMTFKMLLIIYEKINDRYWRK